MTTPDKLAIPRPAATIVLLRDSAEGLQTLLLQRNAALANMAGMFVFPGGKLEYSDSDAHSFGLLDETLPALQARLGEADTDAAMAAGLHVAALREALEECGLLLAEPGGSGARLDNLRARRLLAEGLGFAQVLAQLQLRMATRALVPWSRWITPATPLLRTRRFDARFFLAQAPAGQEALHDARETTASLWCTPHSALQYYRDGQIELAPPQIMSLAHLCRYASADQALAAARERLAPAIAPEIYQEGDTQVLCYPGDTHHSVKERALPGPTRLYRQGRLFLPAEGFDALLA
ncbi:NUDIX hydrolase [Comamonas sp. NLF-1-9]|uniref:NUDIX hydrolase n=1 Tax=Comamonas sp. NLF-1-9 TaxID=2853163 RepID=UPI001C495CC9|nr:NUDIX hydrolase [Comamonas sp. NLF-1-9]QXL85052.1 NUDIX hydrolase [Comamonas sp. NLF-1-9]